MKRIVLFAALACVSCTELFPSVADASLSISIVNPYFTTEPKSEAAKLDTDAFLLTVKDAKGAMVYHGRYADSPEKFQLAPGSYVVSAVSSEFAQAAYSSPQYGDEKIVRMEHGASVSVELVCSQVNSGVRLIVDPEFRSAYPNAVIYLKGEGGMLMHSYGETRVAYFRPGKFSITMVATPGADEELVMSGTLEARCVLSLELTASRGVTSKSGVCISVDTARVWTSDRFTYFSSEDPEEDVEDGGLLDVPSALKNVGKVGVWVCGYIVGSCSSSSKVETAPPFSKSTNIVLGARTSFSDKSSCLSVELPSGSVRNALNLVDNPSNLGRKVLLYGNIEASYYSMKGLKSVSKFEWK